MAENGRPSDLTEALTLKIRKLVLQGKKYIEIQDELQILPSTWDQWVYKDYIGFRKMLNDWKAEKLTKQAEEISEDIMSIPHSNGKIIDYDALKLKQKESAFIRETLGKDYGYTRRNELTGKNGESLNPDKEAKKSADDAVDEFLNIENGESEPKPEGAEDKGDTERERPDGEESPVSV